MTYAPSPVPIQQSEIPSYLAREFEKLRSALSLAGDYEVLHNAPTKLEIGMVRYADGTDWNPGSGEGLYVFTSAGWLILNEHIFKAILDVTEANDTLSATGTVSGSVGVLDVTEDNDTLSGTGTVISPPTGSANLTEADDSLSGAGTISGGTSGNPILGDAILGNEY